MSEVLQLIKIFWMQSACYQMKKCISSIIITVHDSKRISLQEKEAVALFVLMEQQPDLFKKGVKSGIEDWIMPSFKGTYEVEVAELGDDSAVLGAAAYAREVFHQEAPEGASVGS